MSGTVDAPSESGAAAAVREMGHLPMDIRPMHAAPPNAQSAEAGSPLVRYLVYPLWTGVNMRALALFYRQMSTMLASGMSMSESLRSIGSRTGGRLGRMIAEAYDSVQRGGCLSDTLARHPRVFGGLQVSLVRVGEGGGMLDQMFDRIASYLEYELSVRRMIAKMMMYPVLVLIFAITVRASIPHITLLVNEGIGEFGAAVWPAFRLYFAWAAGAVIVFKLVFQFDAVKFAWDSAKTAPPVVGTTARKIAMSRFSRALALLYSAGMPIAASVSIAADACGNLSIRRGIRQAVPALQVGQGLTESLVKTRAVMPMVLDMMATGERTGNTDAVLQKVAEYMDDEVDATIHKLGIALFVGMILIAAVVVGTIVVSFYMRMIGGMMEQAP